MKKCKDCYCTIEAVFNQHFKYISAPCLFKMDFTAKGSIKLKNGVKQGYLKVPDLF